MSGNITVRQSSQADRLLHRTEVKRQPLAA